ncbi:MAG TPA: YkgJ family cysteine cluster protein [Candidatus Sumerlaeota bacterium]|nr:MAG: Flagellin N-methylase [candidate division BRC1 bacterium ADurb.BinA292]HOE95681.1 YkgJ family cysteine cluster protein [Candidatus Sumerlaeota bacterium]HOR26992.1 YkgJ family cysteine cluster protein [Candidatus Sumerlaeota bacterium]HPK02135.1 YkgJ family cysteine cluster protein [Candidatus Sumerlaeota bacterium]
MPANPCLQCGACCAFYRASFYWAEADDATPGGVPAELTTAHPPHFRVMRGTEGPNPRCVALAGTIGEAVHCTIHPRRASVCRDFVPSWAEGERNERCDRARAAHGLPPLRPEDWISPDDDLEPAA